MGLNRSFYMRKKFGGLAQKTRGSIDLGVFWALQMHSALLNTFASHVGEKTHVHPFSYFIILHRFVLGVSLEITGKIH